MVYFKPSSPDLYQPSMSALSIIWGSRWKPMKFSNISQNFSSFKLCMLCICCIFCLIELFIVWKEINNLGTDNFQRNLKVFFIFQKKFHEFSLNYEFMLGYLVYLIKLIVFACTLSSHFLYLNLSKARRSHKSFY